MVRDKILSEGNKNVIDYCPTGHSILAGGSTVNAKKTLEYWGIPCGYSEAPIPSAKKLNPRLHSRQEMA
jgi:hypothetical protein